MKHHNSPKMRIKIKIGDIETEEEVDSFDYKKVRKLIKNMKKAQEVKEKDAFR